MTPEEKAIELCDKMMQNTLTGFHAKECATIAVREIIRSYTDGEGLIETNVYEYWDHVIKSIQKL